MGGSACLRPERASSREIRSSHHTRCCVRTEHSPPYLVSIECHTFISRVALFPSPPHRFFRNFRGPTSHSKVLDQRHSTTPTSLLAIDQKLPATDRPAPLLGLAPKISHVIRLLDHSTTSTNVAIPTTGFQCLKDVRGNYVRDCWETTAQRPSTPHRRCRTVDATLSPPRSAEAATGNPGPRQRNDTIQMRNGSFFTSPRPFHHLPKPRVSPALVKGIKMRTSA